MEKYTYSPLDPDGEEIRLITLHPGSVQDPIQISISHAPFKVPEIVPNQSLSTEELNKTLPHHWRAYKTLEGRFIFCHKPKDGKKRTTWDHPAPNARFAITTSIENRNLEAFEPKFEALSYTWGCADDPLAIDVLPIELSNLSNEKSHIFPTTLQVRQNLFNALKHLRRPEAPRTLWIDALSINQENLIERNHQVAYMRDIYKLAHRVIVWLGLGSRNSDLALNTLDYLGQQIEYSMDDYWLPAPDCKEYNWHDDHTSIEYDDRTWQAIADLIMRPWFERLWVIQEVQLANHRAIIQCGEAQLPWAVLRRAFLKCSSIDTKMGKGPARLRSRFRRLRRFARNLLKSDVEMIFAVTCRAKCDDPRDKIYGLLSLLPAPMVRNIQPQYSTPVPEVYKSAFLSYVQGSHRLDLLGLLPSGHVYADLPSWVPGLSSRVSTFDKKSKAVHASGYATAQTVFMPPGTLEVLGVCHSVIDAVSEIMPQDPRRILLTASDFVHEHYQGSPYPASESPDEVLAWTLFMGNIRDRLRRSQLPSLAQVTYSFQRLVRGRFSEGDRWYGYISKVLLGRSKSRIFKTKDGSMGICQQHIKSGDHVVVFLGCCSPIVLRQESSEKHRVLGQCYVHGIANGEAFLGKLPSSWETKVVASEQSGEQVKWKTQFFNSDTQMHTEQDPRLGLVPNCWEEIHLDDDMRIQYPIQHFKNKDTGEVIHGDPRLLPEDLKARGVPLQTFQLI